MWNVRPLLALLSLPGVFLRVALPGSLVDKSIGSRSLAPSPVTVVGGVEDFLHNYMYV